jgi:uncharacterized protein YjbI with pentapeptide repeats
MQPISRSVTTNFPIISDQTDVANLNNRINKNRAFLEALKADRPFQNLLVLMRKGDVCDERLLDFLMGVSSLEWCRSKRVWMENLIIKTYDLEIRWYGTFLPHCITFPLSMIFKPGCFETTEKSHSKMCVLMGSLKKENDSETLDFANADLADVSLVGADLSRANLSGANLSGADLKGAHLSHINFSKANLSKADLSRANLNLSNLSDANLSGANLTGAKLYKTDFSGANLSGADLRTIFITISQLQNVKLTGALSDDKNISAMIKKQEEIEEASKKTQLLSEIVMKCTFQGTQFPKDLINKIACDLI